MAVKKIGAIIKEARTKKGITQAQLADAVDGLSAADIGKIERGEKIPTAAQAKQMAKPLGVTQISLVNALPASAKTGTAKTAAKTSAAKTGTAAKNSSAKTSTAKTSTAKTSSAKSSSAKASGKTSTAKKPSTSKATGTSVKLTATEKKLVEAYRGANSSTKKAALNLLSGKMGLEDITSILLAAKSSSEGGSSSSSSSNSGNAVGSVLQNIFGKLVKGGAPENTGSSAFDQFINELKQASPKNDGDELILLE